MFMQEESLMVLTERGNWHFEGELADFIHKLAHLIHKNHLWPYSIKHM